MRKAVLGSNADFLSASPVLHDADLRRLLGLPVPPVPGIPHVAADEIVLTLAFCDFDLMVAEQQTEKCLSSKKCDTSGVTILSKMLAQLAARWGAGENVATLTCSI